MLEVSTVLFLIAALGGAYLAMRRLREQPIATGLALVHGAISAIALVLLITAAVTTSVGTAVQIALALFVIVALGGFVLFAFHLRDRTLPIPLVLIHGGAALVAFVLLLVGVLG